MNKQLLEPSQADRTLPASYLSPDVDALDNTPQVQQARRFRGMLMAIGRSMLSVDDSTLDLPLRQLRVCVTLYETKESMSELSRVLGMSLSALTQVANRLERQGLVERVFDGSDRRVRFLQLTAKGEELMRSHEQSQLRRMAACLQRLDEGDVERLLDSLAVLVKANVSQPPMNHHHTS